MLSLLCNLEGEIRECSGFDDDFLVPRFKLSLIVETDENDDPICRMLDFSSCFTEGPLAVCTTFSIFLLLGSRESVLA